MAAEELRRVARQAGGPEFKNGLDHRFRQMQRGKGIQAVQKQRLQFRIRHILLGYELRRLSKIAPQGQLGQLPPQALKELQCVGLVDGVFSFVFKQGEFPKGQQLAWGNERAVLPAQPPGLDGQLTIVLGQHRQKGVVVIVVRHPQDDGSDRQIHGVPPVAGLAYT